MAVVSGFRPIRVRVRVRVQIRIRIRIRVMGGLISLTHACEP